MTLGLRFYRLQANRSRENKFQANVLWENGSNNKSVTPQTNKSPSKRDPYYKSEFVCLWLSCLDYIAGLSASKNIQIILELLNGSIEHLLLRYRKNFQSIKSSG